MQVLYDKNGFPVNEQGESVHFECKDGSILIPFTNGKNIIFHPTNVVEVRKAVEDIAEILATDFNSNLAEIETLTFSEEGHKHLAEMGHYYNGEGLKIPRVNRYFDHISNFLNYIGNTGGFNFKYSIYVKFKEKINNAFLCVLTGLYNNTTPQKHIEFAKLWFAEKDKIFEQEMNLQKQITQEGKPIPPPKQNPYPRIFNNAMSFELFQYLHNNLIRKRTQLADYSFIFRFMQKDGYIDEHTAESEFRDFLFREYEIEIDKLKLIGYCETQSKMNLYSTAINLLKIN